MVAPTLVWAEFDPVAAAISRRLRRRLARAPRRALAGRDSLALAAAALEITSPRRGPLLRLADGGGRDERAWFLAEPVNLVADRDRLRLRRLGGDGLDPAESAALIAAARECFADGEIALESRVSGRWYFAYREVADAELVAPETAANSSAFEAIPQGTDGRRLARMLTELQILWYEHDVNHARHAAGRIEANALWVWEGGRLPAAPVLSQRPRVFANAPEITGLATWLGLDRAALGSPAIAGEAHECLVVIEAGEEPAGSEWLEELDGRGRAFTLVIADAALAVPARRKLFRRR